MKQKITLEIDNDTGVEFEETMTIDLVNKGQYYYSTQRQKIARADRDICVPQIVLTPKIDHELESARKKFPVGSYYKTTSRMKNVFAMVESVERCSETNNIIICTDAVFVNAITCTTFPLPTWRCCESDKPKRDGSYLTREKGTKEWKTVRDFSVVKGWQGNPYNPDEWLDEGEL